MYMIFPFILLIIIICAIVTHWRKKSIIKKICSLSVSEKLCRLDELIRPFGFEYLLSQDIFTSCPDAWQRDYGYCWLYDKHADLFNMVFDCEPIYFDYDGCTWLIELWKGQYGINTGAEIGIYKADSYVPRIQRKSTLFHTVPNEELPFFELTLYKGLLPLYRISRRHWWLTGFRMGEYTEPELLRLKAEITFPTSEMRSDFLQGLAQSGYSYQDLCICDRQVSFLFSVPHMPQPRKSHHIRSAFAQWKNRLFLELYCHVTKHFYLTVDKLLYLYEYLPFAFRHMMCIQRKRHRKRGRHER